MADSAVVAPGEVGEAMKTKHLLTEMDHDRITAAIATAEKHTSGEIRVYVSHRKVRDPRHAAAHQFVKLGMDKTKHRNAVLIFIAPESQNFAILGGRGRACQMRRVVLGTGRRRHARVVSATKVH